MAEGFLFFSPNICVVFMSFSLLKSGFGEIWSSQYKFGGKGCDIWQKSYPDNNLTLEMPDILSKAALLTDVLTDVPGLQNAKERRGECHESRLLPFIWGNLYSPRVNVAGHLIKEFQRCYPALWGPGSNHKTCGHLRTPSDIFSWAVLAGNVPPNSL